METDYAALLGAASGAIVLVVGKCIDWYIARTRAHSEVKKQEAEISLPANDQAVRVYKEIVEDLRADFKSLTAHLHEQERLYLEAREEKIKLLVQLDAQKQEMAKLQERVTELENKIQTMCANCEKIKESQQ